MFVSSLYMLVGMKDLVYKKNTFFFFFQVFQILAVQLLLLVSATFANTLYFQPKTEMVCPDNKHSCNSDTTCCLLPDGQYGCCMYANVRYKHFCLFTSKEFPPTTHCLVQNSTPKHPLVSKSFSSHLSFISHAPCPFSFISFSPFMLLDP